MNNDLRFDEWHKIKKQVDCLNNKHVYLKEREVWYVKLWKNIWCEQDWKKDFERPVLVVSKVWSLFFCVPMSTNWKNNRYYYKLKKSYFNRDSYLLLSQVRVIDKKRFVNDIWIVSEDDFVEIKKLLKSLYLKGA